MTSRKHRGRSCLHYAITEQGWPNGLENSLVFVIALFDCAGTPSPAKLSAGQAKPKVYLETPIPSLLTAWPSRDLIIAAD